MSGKNEAARELAKLRWSRISPEERSVTMRKIRSYPRKYKPTNKNPSK